MNAKRTATAIGLGLLALYLINKASAKDGEGGAALGGGGMTGGTGAFSLLSPFTATRTNQGKDDTPLYSTSGDAIRAPYSTANPTAVQTGSAAPIMPAISAPLSAGVKLALKAVPSIGGVNVSSMFKATETGQAALMNYVTKNAKWATFNPLAGFSAFEMVTAGGGGQIVMPAKTTKTTIHEEVGADRTGLKTTTDAATQQAQANAQQAAIAALPAEQQAALKKAGVTSIGWNMGGNPQQQLNIAVPKGQTPVTIMRSQQPTMPTTRKTQEQQITRSTNKTAYGK